jgi:monoamine oxidase
MADNDAEVVVIGGGAAGVAAARRLGDASIRCLLVEARSRLGGRAWTVTDPSGFALDLGCGWLHSADRNPWTRIAAQQGATIDKSSPPWTRPPPEWDFSPAEQADFQKAVSAFFERTEQTAQKAPDVAASTLLDPAGRWNGLINSLGTYISGTDLDQLSVKDFDNYADTGVNWRVVEGYGTIISRYGTGLQLMLDCAVSSVDHGGKRVSVETAKGSIKADQVIVTVPSNVVATERLRFTPSLPAKVEAAQGLPLGLADKLFMSLDNAEEFDRDTRVFGRKDRPGTGAYQFRPLGRPRIEAYFGGRLAADLEAHGDEGFFDFAVSELVGLLGGEFARRVKPIHIHRWGHDPFALGSYSSALPGFADCRPVLAAPVDDRLFFAGEACSVHDFSTAHGGWHTGVAAADQVIAARRGQSA